MAGAFGLCYFLASSQIQKSDFHVAKQPPPSVPTEGTPYLNLYAPLQLALNIILLVGYAKIEAQKTEPIFPGFKIKC